MSYFFGLIFVAIIAIALGAILAGYMARPREDGNGRPKGPWCRYTMSTSALIAAFLYIPMAAGLWVFPRAFILYLVAVCALYALYILYPSHRFRPAAIYWGSLSALGGVILRWGLYATDLGLNHPTQPLLYGLAGLIPTVSLTLATIIGIVVHTSRRADRDSIVFRLHEPSAVKYVKIGPAVVMAIADLTGVPLPKERMPRNIRRAAERGEHEVVWQWMLQNLALRADPRPFLTNWAWLIPAGFYAGIIKFTKVAHLVKAVLQRFGMEYATLAELPDQDFSKGPFSTGPSGPEVSITIGFNLRMVNPFKIWTVTDWTEQVDHLVDLFMAGLVEIVGADLYGFLGNPRQLDQAGTVRRGSSIYPDPSVMGETPRPGFGQAVADLIHAFEFGMASTLGMQVSTLRIKDVDVDQVIRDINQDRLRTWASRTIASAQADTIRQVATARIDALLAAARKYGVPVEQMPAILLEAVRFYFLNGGDANNAILGVLDQRRGQGQSKGQPQDQPKK